jgi:Coenzyme PQQ synthesis protein D (PqqD)
MGIMKLRVDDITWREIDGDLVVLDLRSSTYLTANASGTVLMRQLTERRTLQQLTEALVDAFDIPEDAAQRDVQAFVDDLGERGLLDRTDSSAAISSAPQTPSPTPAAGSPAQRR